MKDQIHEKEQKYLAQIRLLQIEKETADADLDTVLGKDSTNVKEIEKLKAKLSSFQKKEQEMQQ